MHLPGSLKSGALLFLGLFVGAAGAVLFLQSLPAPVESWEEKARKFEFELGRAKTKILELEAKEKPMPQTVLGKLLQPENKESLAGGVRTLGERLRAGQAVGVDEIFNASKPLIRDLAPLFDRMRRQGEQDRIDAMSGELSRKYHLGPHQQHLLKEWFQKQSEQQAKQWEQMLASDNVRMSDLMKDASGPDPTDGLDKFMPTILPGDQLGNFISDRLEERARRVQNEADARIQKLDGMVGLDNAQRDQLFGLFARNSKQYDPQMQIEGASMPSGPVSDLQGAVRSVLRPEQWRAYEEARQKQRKETAEEMKAIGLLPSQETQEIGF